MRRLPFAPLAGLAIVLAASAALVALVGLSGGSSLWLAFHACARAGATLASLPELAAVALAASVLVLGVWQAASQGIRSRRMVSLAGKAAVPAPFALQVAAQRLGIARLVVTELAGEHAYCAGLWRPSVLVSTDLLAALELDALRAVLAHEAAHARRRDPLRQILGSAAARGLWFVPVARALAARQRLRLELVADQYAEAIAGRRALARALLVLHGPAVEGGAAVAGGANMLEARIDGLAGCRRVPRLAAGAGLLVRSVLGLTLCALIVVLVGFGPAAGSNPVMAMPMNGHDIAQMALAWLARAGTAGLAWIAFRLLADGGSLPER